MAELNKRNVTFPDRLIAKLRLTLRLSNEMRRCYSSFLGCSNDFVCLSRSIASRVGTRFTFAGDMGSEYHAMKRSCDYAHAAKRMRTERWSTHQSAAISLEPHLSGTALGRGSCVFGWRPLRRSRRAAARPLSLLPAIGPGQARSSPRRRTSP